MDVQRCVGSSSKEIWPWSCDVFVLNFITEDNRSFVEDLRNALHTNGVVMASRDSIAQAPMDKYKLCVFIISKNCGAQTRYLEENLKGCVNFLPIFWERTPFKSDRPQVIGNILENHINNILREKRARISSLYDAKKIDISGEIATVGIGHDRVEKLIEILKLGSKDDVRVVGISGMGGVGKTALAGDVFNKISHRFDSAYFISIPSNKDMLKEAFLRIAFPEEFEPQYSESLRLLYRMLVVFDDVDHQGLLDEGWIRGLFGGGSRIIITSRDEGLLRYLGADEIHKVELLNQNEALRLFSKIVFKCFRGEKCVLTRLQTDPDFSMIAVLQKSFDGLSLERRKAFLDIACCFAGQKTDYVKGILRTEYPGRYS
ncbi:disease resistance protein Roq1-like [Prosopis cineraria]|uniref:disease resistance protein Roq1-like n=1 Tax=Prosopis cineraria TaxID=364024 RepID=UPI00240FA6D3|nr:disease resistance protein Roq1-like [Prosopis cineraria]